MAVTIPPLWQLIKHCQQQKMNMSIIHLLLRKAIVFFCLFARYIVLEFLLTSAEFLSWPSFEHHSEEQTKYRQPPCTEEPFTQHTKWEHHPKKFWKRPFIYITHTAYLPYSSILILIFIHFHFFSNYEALARLEQHSIQVHTTTDSE